MFQFQLDVLENYKLQPLDLAFNDPFKREMKECFTKWYASLVKKQLDQGKDVSEIKPDLRTSTVKPIHARWLMEVLYKLDKNSDMIVSGFEKAGIKDFVVNP